MNWFPRILQREHIHFLNIVMDARVLTDPLCFNTLQYCYFSIHLWTWLFYLWVVGDFIIAHWSLAASMLPGVARCHRLILNISHLNLDATNVSKAPWFLSVGKVLGDYSMDTKSSLLLYQLLILNPSVDTVRK